mgnify:CR=1 FL=1|tara:strand:- start:29681 stop:29884 length:204 start_codon:yes stop_codon:yes gene_type:complete
MLLLSWNETGWTSYLLAFADTLPPFRTLETVLAADLGSFSFFGLRGSRLPDIFFLPMNMVLRIITQW